MTRLKALSFGWQKVKLVSLATTVAMVAPPAIDIFAFAVAIDTLTGPIATPATFLVASHLFFRKEGFPALTARINSSQPFHPLSIRFKLFFQIHQVL